MRIIFSFFMIFLTLHMTGQDLPAYQLFNAKGKKTTFKKMTQQSLNHQVVLFGEYHNNPICHWMQLKLTEALHNKIKLVIGAEMIETDNQQALNQYLAGKIDQKALDSLARLWSNYKTDYKPLVDFAKDNQ